MSDAKRLFFGLPIAQRDADRWVNRLKLEARGVMNKVRITRPGNFHITIRFLGEVEPQRVPELVAAVTPVINRFRPFDIVVDDIDHFPNPRSHMLAVNVKLDRYLEKLFTEIEAVMVQLGFPRDSRFPRPHITLARGKRDARFRMRPIVLSEPALSIHQFVLYESVVGDKGLAYIPLHQFNLSPI